MINWHPQHHLTVVTNHLDRMVIKLPENFPFFLFFFLSFKILFIYIFIINARRVGIGFLNQTKRKKRMVFSVSIILSLGKLMKETLRYLAGIAGPSGYGSNSTAEQVTQNYSISSSSTSHPLTAIITGNSTVFFFFFSFCMARQNFNFHVKCLFSFEFKLIFEVL